MSNEIIIIGGGIIGLSIAIELKLKGCSVTVLSRNFAQSATNAAAGMLAPRAEKLDDKVMLDLALQSLGLYPEWVNKITQISGENVDFNPCGIIAPVYQTPKSTNSSYHSVWLDQNTIKNYQPDLSEKIVGGWWHPEDGQVDPRLLGSALLKTAQSLGVEIKEGIEAIAFSRHQGKIKNILTQSGIFEGEMYIVAGGAWSSKLLPLPLRPVKGQMLSLQIPSDVSLPRVIFGENIYLVPKKNSLIVGATVEDIGWQDGNTPMGMQSILEKATGLYPPLANWNIDRMWYGYRPTTVDQLPILGNGDAENLILATGHHRNGILLAPITAQLISNLVVDRHPAPILQHFSYDRFVKPQSHTQAQSSSPSLMNYPTPLQNNHQNNNIIPSHNSHFDDDDCLVIAGRKFRSRLMTGTGKYPDITSMQKSVVASECEIVTVAVRRVQTKAPGHEGLAEALDWSKIWMLPNTAGCKDAEEAIRVARLGREMAKLLGQEDNNFVKLEVIPDPKYLLPDPIGTLQAAEQLVKEGFAVLPYVNADPLLCKRLEEVGCATVMPLGSPIGSGQGVQNLANIKIIIEQANVPVVVDAGIGTPSEATLGMEVGADALLINSAIALAKNPPKMARAMALAAQAGRLAYTAGRIPVKEYASASSPLTGVVK